MSVLLDLLACQPVVLQHFGEAADDLSMVCAPASEMPQCTARWGPFGVWVQAVQVPHNRLWGFVTISSPQPKDPFNLVWVPKSEDR